LTDKLNWKVFESKGKLWRIYTVSLLYFYLIHDNIYIWSTYYVHKILQFRYNIQQVLYKLSKTMTRVSEFHWNKQYLNVIIGISVAHFTRSDTQSLRAILYFIAFVWSSGIMECTCMLFTFENGVLLMR